MKKILGLIVVLLVAIYACNNSESGKNIKKHEASIMYNPSELALLMKQMHAQQQAWKQLIEKDSFSNVNFPVNFMGIYTVEPTDSFLKVRDNNFIGLADKYIDNVKTLTETKKYNKQVKRYNATINACINCHNDYCQGPIDKIKKLYID